MSFILCIETGTSVCSVALGSNGKLVDFEESNVGNGDHSKNLTRFIQIVLQRQNLQVKDLDAICIAKGPGSYTGLRIGTSVAKGLCYAANIPLISVGSLHSMAQGAKEMLHSMPSNGIQPHLLCPMIDARRMEVYSQMFTYALEPATEVEAKILDNQSYKEELEKGKVLFFGNGSNKARELFQTENALFLDEFLPSARFMILLAQERFNQKKFEDVAYFEPFYLKDFVATKAKNMLLG